MVWCDLRLVAISSRGEKLLFQSPPAWCFDQATGSGGAGRLYSGGYVASV